jgi:hypothetical protein
MSIGRRFVVSAAAFFALSCMPSAASAQAPAAAPYPTAQGQAIPGVDQVFALESVNALYIIATQEGFERVAHLVKVLDGDLDLVQTRFDLVEATAEDLKSLGVNVTGSTPLIAPSDNAILVRALSASELSRAAYPLRITTRDTDVIDESLEQKTDGGAVIPLSFVSRENTDGSIEVELMQPVSALCEIKAGQTAVLAMPGVAPDTVRLLFVTANLAPRSRSYR